MDSMTGYGRGAARRDGREITVEFKAVNHRFLEYSSRVPRAYAYLEEKLKNRMASQIVTDRNRAVEAESRLRQLIEKQAVRDRHRLELMSSRLDGLSPLKKIGGGYGFLTNDKNRRIESVEQVKKGDLIQMRIRDGRIDAVVSGTAAAELGAR